MSKKDREIGNLKDECADAHESSTCAKKARKNAPSMMNESNLKVENEKEVNKELEDELLIFKKKSMEQYEMGFFKVIR